MISIADRAASFLSANLDAVKAGARRAIETALDGGPTVVDVSADGASACVVASDGRRIPIHSSADPVGAADTLLAQVVTRGDTPLLIVIGLGLGYFLDAVERRGGNLKVLAIEPVPAIARAMLARRDWRQWIASGRLTLLVGPEYTGSADAWRTIPTGALEPPIVASPLMEQEFPVETKRAKTIAQQVVGGARSNEKARRAFAGLYLLNTLANIPAIVREGDARSLVDAFAGMPAIVIGAGPSLDANIEQLRQIQDRALLIAVDTAVRPLLAGGVTPHLVVAVDPSALNARHLDRLPDTRGMWFVAEGSIDPRVFPQFINRTFTFRVSNHHPWPWLGSLGAGRAKLEAWGSVLTTAFDLACRAGCNPIVFAGADLAYTDGLRYCRNTVYEEDWTDLVTNEARARAFAESYFPTRQTLTQPDVQDEPVLTAPQFIQFRNWIVARADVATDQKIVNATGRGILRGGRIVQAALGSMVGELGEGRVDVAARLRTAWAASGDTPRLGQVAVGDALDRRGSAVPKAEWLAFGGDTATDAQVDEAIDAARDGTSALVHKAAYRAMVRQYYDGRATSLDEAERLMHPDYASGRRQAGAHQAHLLLEYLLRSYPVTAGRVGDVASAATALRPDVRALDVGCGVGRGMEPLVEAGLRVDGVDISRQMIGWARMNPTLASSQFFVSGGGGCGDAPDGAYDLAYSQRCFQHLCSRSIRNDLLQAMARALRPGGVVVVQLLFYRNYEAGTVPAPHVPWSADHFEATSTNGAADVWATPDELPLIVADVARHFRDVRLQFVEFPVGTTGATEASHLLISGTVGHTLGARMYAPGGPP